MTGRLIAQQWMSVDGMVSGPRDEFELFATAPPESGAASEAHNSELVAGLDAMVLGRRSYESYREVWPTSDNPMAAQVNALPKVVCSSTLTEAPWGRHAPGQVVRDGVAWAQSYRAEGNGTAVVWGSIAVMNSLIAAGQLDEVELFVTPVLLGDGVALRGRGKQAPMTLSAVEQFPGGVLRLRYALTH